MFYAKKMSCGKCPGLSLAISAQFTLKCVLQPKVAEKFTKPPILRVQDHSRSSTLTAIKKPIISTCYDKQHVCAYLQPCSRYT